MIGHLCQRKEHFYFSSCLFSPHVFLRWSSCHHRPCYSCHSLQGWTLTRHFLRCCPSSELSSHHPSQRQPSYSNTPSLAQFSAYYRLSTTHLQPYNTDSHHSQPPCACANHLQPLITRTRVALSGNYQSLACASGWRMTHHSIHITSVMNDKNVSIFIHHSQP